MSNFPKATQASDASRIQTQVSLAIKFELLILVDSKLMWVVGSKVGTKLEN